MDHLVRERSPSAEPQRLAETLASPTPSPGPLDAAAVSTSTAADMMAAFIPRDATGIVMGPGLEPVEMRLRRRRPESRGRA